MARRPFSVRGKPETWSKYDGPHSGVPPWLVNSLAMWAISFLTFEDDFTGRRTLHQPTILGLSRRFRRQLPQDLDSFGKLITVEGPVLLDVVDFILESNELSQNRHYWPDHVTALSAMLLDAGSVYTVGPDAGGRAELQTRASDAAIAAGVEAMAPNDRAAERLRAAWSKAFGRDPDANGAFDHAVKAVETAGKATVSPDNAITTLGTMIADLKSKPSKWTTVLACDADVEKVIGMMELLWRSHYRHGDESKPTISHSPAEAEMAVQLAVALVQILRARGLSRI